MRVLAAAIALALVACGAAHPMPEPTAEVDAGASDPDRDGVLGALDRCPCDAEDADGWQDDDGCPDPDNDGDRIVDACDLCPNDPETFQGRCDEDGCPDRSHICVEQAAIEIHDQVYFERGDATPMPTAAALLDAIAATLNGNPQIALVAIVAGAETREPHHEGLAQRRAEAVLDALAQRGVVRERLVAEPESDVPDARGLAQRHARFEVRSVIGGDGGGCGTPSPCNVPVCEPPAPSVPAC